MAETMAGNYFASGLLGPRRPIRLGPVLKEGAMGTIHRVIGEKGTLAKMYKDPRDFPKYQAKLAAMLAAPPRLPPIAAGARSYVQLAWPTANVLDGRGAFMGFLMPEVDFKASTELENVLQKAARRQHKLPEFYGNRIVLAANLAAVMTEVHLLDHHMIDMKPMNMRFYWRANYMAIIDTDGFSIKGARRFHAQQFSDEYIAPEARGRKPEELGEEQDRFALAVIIFRLLNNGLHPFQGIDPESSFNPQTLQERVFSSLYAYGPTPKAGVQPARASVHGFFEPSTALMFDRAFMAGRPRPSAKEWYEHLKGLVEGKVLLPCSVKPTEHGHFSRGCGFCELERRIGALQGRSSQVKATWRVAIPVAPALAPVPAPAPAQTPKRGKAAAWSSYTVASLPPFKPPSISGLEHKAGILGFGAAVLAMLGYYLIFFRGSQLCIDMCGPGFWGTVGAFVAMVLLLIPVALGSAMLGGIVYAGVLIYAKLTEEP
jgi:DNA-binding helix-hairpin-helix protein with protein kinase domain